MKDLQPRAGMFGALLALTGVMGAPLVVSQEAEASGIHLALVPGSAAVTAGDTLLVEATITNADDLFNAFDLNIAFDPTRFAFVPTIPLSAQRGALMTNACSNIFHNFTAGTSQVSASVSLLCQNTNVAGPGVIYRVKFRALSAPGPASLVCAPGTQFYRAGFFVNPLDCATAQVTITGATAVGPGEEPTHVDGGAILSISPNPCREGAAARFTVRGADGEAVSLSVYDLSGRLVSRVMDDSPASVSGRSIVWGGTLLAPGMYVVRLDTGFGQTSSARWTIIR